MVAGGGTMHLAMMMVRLRGSVASGGILRASVRSLSSSSSLTDVAETVPSSSPLWQSMGPAKTELRGREKVFVRAHESTLVDSEEHSVLDAVAGLWCVNLGYSNDVVKEAIASQLRTLPYASNFSGSTCPSAIEAAMAVRDFFAEDGMHRVLFTSGGSDSVETALKLARQFWKLAGKPGKTKFFSLKRGYHGTHFGGASVNGNARFRQAYEPLLPGCLHMPTPCTYRNPFNETDSGQLAQLIADSFEEEIIFQDADTVAAYIMEPVLGAGGVIVPDETFMRLMGDICDKYNILLIADEVITGFGRTGTWSGSRSFGVEPDMMCIAKGLTSGYFPTGAVCLSERVADVFESSTNHPKAAMNHGYTYSAHPGGAAAAVATIAQYAEVQVGSLDLTSNAALRGTQLYNGMLKLKEKFGDIVGDVRGGRGLMTAVEMVSDNQRKTPMDAHTMKKLYLATYAAGAHVRIAANNICLSPPLIITESEISRILAAFEKGLASL